MHAITALLTNVLVLNTPKSKKYNDILLLVKRFKGIMSCLVTIRPVCSRHKRALLFYSILHHAGKA